MAEIAIPPGARCLTPKRACEKLGRQKSWLWDRVKSDPEFPKPIYYGPNAPVFIDAHLDAWLAAQAEKSNKATA